MNKNLADDILIALRRIIRAIDLYSRRLAQRHGLTVPQLVVLQELRRRGEMPGSELARAVSLSQATVTGILSRLAARGLVVRRRSVSDRRRLPVRLTEAGAALVAAAPPLLQESFCAELGKLAEWEQTQILSNLQRLVAMMEAEDVAASPLLTTEELGAPATGVALSGEPRPGGGRPPA
jgi:DNA-binding MarR family transcriptional regulator